MSKIIFIILFENNVETSNQFNGQESFSDMQARLFNSKTRMSIRVLLLILKERSLVELTPTSDRKRMIWYNAILIFIVARGAILGYSLGN